MLQFSFDEIENRIQLTQRALVFGRVTQEDVQCADVEDSDPETRATAACSRSAVTLSTRGRRQRFPRITPNISEWFRWLIFRRSH